MSGPGKIMTELKAELRKRLLMARSGLSKKYCQQADRAILEKLLAQPVYRRAKVIFTYVSTEAETDTRHLIRLALAAGKTVAVPKCTEKGMMKALKIWRKVPVTFWSQRLTARRLSPRTSTWRWCPASPAAGRVPGWGTEGDIMTGTSPSPPRFGLSCAENS